jgi:hypothetical protein
MKMTTTDRGFQLVEFKDFYGTPCSIQQSSIWLDDAIAGPGTSALWLGTDDVMAKVLWHDASAVGIKTSATEGWVDYPIPSEVSLRTRMHLNREQVKELIAHLTSWLETGKL